MAIYVSMAFDEFSIGTDGFDKGRATVDGPTNSRAFSFIQLHVFQVKMLPDHYYLRIRFDFAAKEINCLGKFESNLKARFTSIKCLTLYRRVYTHSPNDCLGLPCVARAAADYPRRILFLPQVMFTGAGNGICVAAGPYIVYRNQGTRPKVVA